MSPRLIFRIARQELTVSVRNRWTLIYAVVFAVLVVSISYVGVMAEGFSGMQNFTRTSASMLNMVLYIVPLVSLLMGTLSFTGEKGTTELLFSQPVDRKEILFGKVLGLFVSLSLSMLIGFVAAGGIISSVTGAEGLFQYFIFVLLSLLLALVFLVMAVVIATVNNRKTKSYVFSLFAWFFFVFFYDLAVLGASLFFKGQNANYFLFLSLFGNPVDMVRVSSLIILDNVTIFGAAGAALLRFLGGSGSSVSLLVGSLLIWVIAPVLLSTRLLRNQDV